MIRKILFFFLLTFLVTAGYKTVLAAQWAEAPANLTIREFLDLYFYSHMARGESNAINSFNLVSFYPSDNSQTAFVFIIQTWRDSGIAERDLRREIRKVGDSYYKLFKGLIKLPDVKKRWNINNIGENIIIKHVRISDLNEVLAVTINGVTHFDRASIRRTESIVKARGGVWSF